MRFDANPARANATPAARWSAPHPLNCAHGKIECLKSPQMNQGHNHPTNALPNPPRYVRLPLAVVYPRAPEPPECPTHTPACAARRCAKNPSRAPSTDGCAVPKRSRKDAARADTSAATPPNSAPPAFVCLRRLANSAIKSPIPAARCGVSAADTPWQSPAPPNFSPTARHDRRANECSTRPTYRSTAAPNPTNHRCAQSAAPMLRAAPAPAAIPASN